MTEPDVVHGAWMRRSASVDGGSRFETQLVVWLQAGTYYADIRVPLHPAGDERCFTGRSFWEGERYRWTHVLDMASAPGAAAGADDVGDLAWEEDALVERGVLPSETGWVPYEEVWCRMPGGDGPAYAIGGGRECLVRVGDHAITVVDGRTIGGGFAACYQKRTDSGWEVVAGIGAGALPGPGDPPAWDRLYADTAVPR